MDDPSRALSGDGAEPLGARALDAGEYRALLHRTPLGFCVFEMLLDAAGRPIDYRFLEVNPVFERLTGLVAPVGRTALELVPNLEPHWIEVYGRVALTGESTHFEQGSAAMGRWFEVYAFRVGEPDRRRVALIFNDITSLRQAQQQREQAESAARDSADRFRTLADTAPAMLWVTEPDGRCSYLSRGWYLFTGQTEADGLEFGWLDAVHPADRDAAGRTFSDANLKQIPFELQHRVRRHDGAYRWVIDAGRPRLAVDGSFEGYVGSVIDIHDRKVAEERLDITVESGRIGLWYCDLPFDVLVWTPQVKEHFGLPPDAHVTIDTFFERLHPHDREPTRDAIDAALVSGTTFDVQYRTIGLDGRTRWIRAVGKARYDATRAVSFDGVTIDVTELVSLRESAEAASRAKDEFLAMLGHELRNPLAPILTALQLLKLRGFDAVERERSIIERQVRHLVGLVDDLLDVSRITRGRIELHKEPVEVADVVARAVEIASPLLEQQRHRLEVDVPRGLIVDADAGRLSQVVANLLTNAAKYTEPGGSVFVRATAADDGLTISVRDTGLGIDAAMLPRIFELFVQEPQTLARSQGGLGLGLAIVRSLVALHGGTVSARSDGIGCGSEFVVRLPRSADWSATAGDGAGRMPTRARRTRGTRVLIVDDNHDAATLLGVLLDSFGYDTRIAHDAHAALIEADRYAPHVALIDIGLPVMDGFELAERLAGLPGLRDTKLVAVTGYGQDSDRERSARAGFAAHLVKPVDAEELRAMLEAVSER